MAATSVDAVESLEILSDDGGVASALDLSALRSGFSSSWIDWKMKDETFCQSCATEEGIFRDRREVQSLLDTERIKNEVMSESRSSK